jgi:hypothetical protein
MAVNYVAVLKTNRMQDVADVINAKTITAATGGGTVPKLVIGTSGLSGATGVLSTHTLSNPVGTVSGSVLTITLPTAVNASATGTAALAEIRTAADVVIVSGLVCGVGSGEVQLNSLSITSGQSVNITAASITHS